MLCAPFKASYRFIALVLCVRVTPADQHDNAFSGLVEHTHVQCGKERLSGFHVAGAERNGRI